MADEDKLLDHNYDDIQEYDNDLPLWWVWLFIITVVIAIVYPFLYDFRGGQFAEDTLPGQMAELAKLKAGSAPAAGDITDEKLLALTKDTTVVKKGSEIFTVRCVACHGPNAQGLIGPNLTDDYWIHGGKLTEIRNTVTNGVLDKGMLAWKDQLSSDEISAVVAYVWSIHGSNPPNPKEPQGNKVAFP